MKPPGRKRRQVKAKPTEATVEAGEEDEESDSEEESPPLTDSGLPHTRLDVAEKVRSFPFPKQEEKIATCISS